MHDTTTHPTRRARRGVAAGVVGAAAAAALGVTLVGAGASGVHAATIAGSVSGNVAGSLAGLGVGAAAAAGPGWTPPADTIVEVTGDAANGFSIHHLDGSSLHPPTDSKAAAECAEYDTEVQVAVCQVEVETWYRDLADLQVALRWARHDAGRGSGHRLHS